MFLFSFMKRIILIIGILLFSLSFVFGGDTCEDLDGDNFGEGCSLGIDCDDSNPNLWYWRPFYLNEDHDGYGTGEIIHFACWGNFESSEYPLDERSFNNDDCEDLNRDIYPGASEICGNGIDEDCNGADLECLTDKLVPIKS